MQLCRCHLCPISALFTRVLPGINKKHVSPCTLISPQLLSRNSCTRASSPRRHWSDQQRCEAEKARPGSAAASEAQRVKCRVPQSWQHLEPTMQALSACACGARKRHLVSVGEFRVECTFGQTATEECLRMGNRMECAC